MARRKQPAPQTDEEAMAQAQAEKKRGKSPATQAQPFVHEEIEHVKKGHHTARSAKQAVAIGLSKARKHGIPIKRPSSTRRKAA